MLAILFAFACISLWRGCETATLQFHEVHENHDAQKRGLLKLPLLNTCRGELGCFNNDGGFIQFPNRPVSFYPQRRSWVNVQFFLTTRRNTTATIPLDKHDVINSTRASLYDPARETKFVVHGFTDSVKSQFCVVGIVEALLHQGDYNVITVDWSRGAGFPYTQATANTRLVGAEVAVFIEKLKKAGLIESSKIHIIGHSLGAHTAGYAGTRTKIHRISALDPAEPYFEGTDPLVRLDPTDAAFVDVIHTDGITTFSNGVKGGWGMSDPVGHVDFYPNGGRYQPGCTDNILTSVTTEGINGGTMKFVICAHRRACKLYTESLNTSSCVFSAFPCKSWETFQDGQCLTCGSSGCPTMGYFADKYNGTGKLEKFYLKTTDGNKEFCGYHYEVRVTIGKKAKSVQGKLHIDLMGHKYSGMTQPNKNARTFEGGKTYKFVIFTPNPLGKLLTATVKWEYVSTWYKPWKWSIFGAPGIHTGAIYVVDLTTAQSWSFCTGGKKLDNGKTRVVAASRTPC